MQTLKLTKKYTPYPEYKDSGVEWLGRIPSDWGTEKLKRVSFVNKKTLPENTDPNFTFQYLDIGSVNENEVLNVEERLIFENSPSRARRIVSSGDSIIATVRTYLKAISYFDHVKADTIASTGFAVLTPSKKLQPKYLYYYLLSDRFINQVIIRSKGVSYPAITPVDLGAIEMNIPPKEVQLKIINYLDEKTLSIDKIIEKKQKQIELLREKRASVINLAVTKGIDSKKELTESEISWIGKIPKKWKVSSLKTLLEIKITDGPHTTPQLLEEGVRFISAESIQANNTIDFNKNRGFISNEDHIEFCKKAKPQRDDIFMVKSGATTGRVAIVETDSEFSIWSPLALIRADKNKSLPRYIYFFLQSGLFQDQVRFSWSFGTQQNIGMRVIENLMIIYPSLEDQKSIVDHLDSKMPNFDLALQKVEDSIKKLQEFKSSLISNVVTGKIEV